MSTAVTTIRFGAKEMDRPCLISGWAFPESKFTWTTGTESALRLAYDPAGGDLQLEFSLWPFTAEPHPRHQLLEVLVGGRRVGSERIERRTTFGFRLPRREFEQTGVLDVRLRCPNATAPAWIGEDHDTRQLGVAVEAVTVRQVPEQSVFNRRQRSPLPIEKFTGSERDQEIVRKLTVLSPSDLALNFESLGTNCEFGLFQRRCDVESLGMLRFAGVSYSDLIAGLAAGFSGIEDLDGLSCHIEGAIPEWMLKSNKYGVVYHTFSSPNDVTPEELLRKQSSILSFKRSKFLDILRTGEKLFVVMDPHGLTLAQVLPLIAILRSYGPNALLFINDHTGYPAGTVTALDRDLFCGSMDGINRCGFERLHEGDDNWLSNAGLTAWISVCANSYRMWREEGGGWA